MKSENTALILIGYQNDYFSSTGILHGVIEESSRSNKTLFNTVSLLERLMDKPVLFIVTPIVFTPDYEELVDPIGILKIIKETKAFQSGTPGVAAISELEPFREKILEVPGKRGLNAFVGTHLQEVLQQRQITNIAIAGAVTSICIDSTARSAHEKGYQVSILSDCLSARTLTEQQFYCENIFPLYAKVMTHTQFLAQIEN
jgi:nicotinamidase-related amidase